jgi:hypothetical protein
MLPQMEKGPPLPAGAKTAKWTKTTEEQHPKSQGRHRKPRNKTRLPGPIHAPERLKQRRAKQGATEPASLQNAPRGSRRAHEGTRNITRILMQKGPFLSDMCTVLECGSHWYEHANTNLTCIYNETITQTIQVRNGCAAAIPAYQYFLVQPRTFFQRRKWGWPRSRKWIKRSQRPRTAKHQERETQTRNR